MNAKILLAAGLVWLGFMPGSSALAGEPQFVPGEVWRDSTGQPINAHGGGVLFHNGVYYWNGELK